MRDVIALIRAAQDIINTVGPERFTGVTIYSSSEPTSTYATLDLIPRGGLATPERFKNAAATASVLRLAHKIVGPHDGRNIHVWSGGDDNFCEITVTAPEELPMEVDGSE